MRGSFKRIEAEERHAFSVLFFSAVAIVWWVALWGLIEDTVDRLERRYGVTRRTVYGWILFGIAAFIFLFPELLEKF